MIIYSCKGDRERKMETVKGNRLRVGPKKQYVSTATDSLTPEGEDEPPSWPRPTYRERYFPDVSHKDWADWKWQFRNRITSISELAQYVPFNAQELEQLSLVEQTFPISISPYYLSLMNPDEPNDPIGLQAIPSFQELTLSNVGTEDPLGEEADSVVPGLVHRYPDRVLMVLTDICPMLCRHCTRKREWKHGGWMRNPQEIEAMLAYIRRTKTIRDIIISGGDVLTLSNKNLESVISRLRAIPHVEIIRIGSRFPVVLPQRIDAEFCEMLSKYGPIWFNTHFNHPNEITAESAQAVDRLIRAGVPVNNQSVLLRGVNDNPEVMMQLNHGLLRIKVRPYYLYQCDEVQGTEHLRTSVETGIRIIESLQGHTSGLAVPTFVIDLPGGGGKVPLQPNHVLAQSDSDLTLRNYEGLIFKYRNPVQEPKKMPAGKRPSAPRVSRNYRRSNRTIYPGVMT